MRSLFLLSVLLAANVSYAISLDFSFGGSFGSCARRAYNCERRYSSCRNSADRSRARCDSSFAKKMNSCDRTAARADNFIPRCTDSFNRCVWNSNPDREAGCRNTYNSCMDRATEQRASYIDRANECAASAAYNRGNCVSRTGERRASCRYRAEQCAANLISRCGPSINFSF